MKKFILHPLIAVLALIVSTSFSLNAQYKTPQLYVAGTVSSNEKMLVTVRGTMTIEGNTVVAELNGKKTEMLTNKNGQAILDFSSFGAFDTWIDAIPVPKLAVIRSFDKDGKLLSTANTIVHPGFPRMSTAPVMENLPANLLNSDVVTIKGRNLGADAQLFCGNQVQEVLSASDREITVFTNSKTGEQPLHVSTANGVSQRQSVNIYSFDFTLAKNSFSPAETVQAAVMYESIPVGTKLIFITRSPGVIQMNIPGVTNTANECMYCRCNQK